MDCLYDIAELLVLTLNSFGLNTTGNLIHVIQWEEFCIQVFLAKIKNIGDCIALLLSKEQESFSQQVTERVKHHDPDGVSSKPSYPEDIKFALQRQTEHVKHGESFCPGSESGVQQQILKKNCENLCKLFISNIYNFLLLRSMGAEKDPCSGMMTCL